MELNTKAVHFQIKGNLLICTYKRGVLIDLKTAKQIVSDRILFIDGNKKAVVILGNGVVTIDREAREFLSSGEGTKGLTAAAIVTESIFGSFMSNFFLAANKTTLPVKIFSDQKAAENWLQKFNSPS